MYMLYMTAFNTFTQLYTVYNTQIDDSCPVMKIIGLKYSSRSKWAQLKTQKI